MWFGKIILKYMNTKKENIIQYVRESRDLLASSELLGRQSARAEAILEKLEEENITVAVIGQFKRGKSALVNALLGQDLLPVGIIPVTTSVTEIRRGPESASILFRNGLVKPVPLEGLSSYISEAENPDNHLEVSTVRIQSPSPFLSQGLTLVDTPGVGSFHKHNTEAAYAFVRESDAVIFMLSVDTPINEIEIEFLRNTREFAGKFFFVINKVDLVSQEELDLFLDYVGALLVKLMENEEGQKLVLFPVSAKNGTGLESLRNALLKECKTGLLDILCESTRLKLYNIIVEALGQIELYWKVLQMTPKVLDRTILEMEKEVEAFRDRAKDTVKRLEANSDIIIPGLAEMLDGELNNLKLDLTDTVTKVFGMDYHYEIIETGPLSEASGNGSSKGLAGWAGNSGATGYSVTSLASQSGKESLASILGQEFLTSVEFILDDLTASLNRVLLYRNQSTYEVVTHIYALNRLTRELRRRRDWLNLSSRAF